MLAFLKHIDEFPELRRPVFVDGSVPFTCTNFLHLLDPIHTEGSMQGQVLVFEFIDNSTKETLLKLLCISTVFQSIPPWGFVEEN